jgi:F-type H+-transporting ATPase subunit delta
MAHAAVGARRYAEAAFQVAEADDALDQWQADLRTAAEILGMPEAAAVVDSPAVPLQQRLAVTSALLESRIAPPVLRLVSLLVERGRAPILGRVADEFTRQLNRQRGIVVATVTSALPLTPDELNEITSRVEAMAGSQVDLRTEVDPAIIGGLTIQVGDRLLDASIRGRLERLRDQLHTGARPR